MSEFLKMKLKKDGETVGYLKIERGFLLVRSLNGKDFVLVTEQNASGGIHLLGDDEKLYIDFDTAHPFVCPDRNGKDVYAEDKVKAFYMTGDLSKEPWIIKGIIKQMNLIWYIADIDGSNRIEFRCKDIELIE